MTNIEKIRAALGMARHAAEFCALPGLAAKTDEARAALAELERAATEPVAWIVGQQTMGGDVAEVLRWSRGTPPISVSGAPRPLYTAAQPAPGMPEVEGLRLRSVSQILIREIGAAGPENAEDSARRACGVIQRQADQIVSADTRIAALESAITVRDTEIARLEADLELARIGARRYQFMWQMSPREFEAMWCQVMATCAQFDELVDAKIAARAGNGGEG